MPNGALGGRSSGSTSHSSCDEMALPFAPDDSRPSRRGIPKKGLSDP